MENFRSGAEVNGQKKECSVTENFTLRISKEKFVLIICDTFEKC